MDYQGDFPLRLSPPIGIGSAAAAYGEEEEYMSDLAGDWVDVTAVSNFIMNPSPMVGYGDELALAVATSQRFRGDTNLEISTMIFSKGEFIGYSVGSKTGYLSDNPTIAVDAAGNIHLAWREGAGGTQVYYATSSPTGMAALDPIAWADILNALLLGSVESLASIAFVPFIGLGWILPGMVVLIVWTVYKDRQHLGSPSSWLLTAIAIFLYYGTKIIFLPTITTYIPFSAWIGIPDGIARFVQIGVAAMIFLLSLLAAIFVRRRYSEASLAFYTAFTLTDAFLTLAIYGVNLLGFV
jgi:hypothetical protein